MKVSSWLKCEVGHCLEFTSLLINLLKVPIEISIRFSLFILFLGVLSGCSLIESGDSQMTLGSERSLLGPAFLECGAECSTRGQCGQSDQGAMVLLNSAGPATFGHDMAIPDGFRVEIIREEPMTAVQLSDNEQISLSFYMIVQPEYGEGWVAGWCLGQ